MTKQTAEQLFRANVRGAMTYPTSPVAAGAFFGVASIASGGATQTVSTTAVTSDAVIFVTSQPSSLSVGMNSGGAVVVSSLVDGVSFAVAAATGVGYPYGVSVNWEIKLR